MPMTIPSDIDRLLFVSTDKDIPSVFDDDQNAPPSAVNDENWDGSGEGAGYVIVLPEH